jgi:hypothetical protein
METTIIERIKGFANMIGIRKHDFRICCRRNCKEVVLYT